MPYVIGTDIGGTFTDTVVIDDAGHRVTAKASTTPDDPVSGAVESVTAAAEKLDLTFAELLAETDVFFHGTTLVTNALVEGERGDVGFLTTKGAEDEIHIGQVKTRTAGLPFREIQRLAGMSKPEPLVEKPMIHGITERTDYKGEEITPLDEDEVLSAIDDLRSKDVDSIAVSFLWSFADDSHERRVQELIEERTDVDVYTALSSEVAPKLGEYMRGATTLINAITGPLMSSYLTQLNEKLRDNGLDGPIYLMQSNGGVLPITDAAEHAEGAVSSGPAAGVVGTRFVGESIDREDIICTDVGGTSFDVGLITDGNPKSVPEQVVNRYSLHQKAIDIESIGSGGGSIAWVDETGHLHVGPESAGADPGPACYADGGDRPTATDACLLLGYLDPENFLGGDHELDVAQAREAMREHVAEPMDMSVEEASAAVVDIMNSHMSDLLRKLTVKRGYDPRNFDMFAYGGAGPMFSSFYGQKIGVDSVVVPLSRMSPVYSAFGITTSDLTWVEERTDITNEPFDRDEINGKFRELRDRAEDQLLDVVDTDEADIEFEYRAEMRYQDQIKEIDIPLPDFPLSSAQVENLSERYEDELEKRFGKGAKYASASVQISTFHVTASVPTLNPTIAEAKAVETAGEAHTGTRDAYWFGPEEFVETDIYDGTVIAQGERIEGPAIVQMPETTVTVRPGQTASVDSYRNIVIEME